ncbi:DUF3040 domain-containing protein [Actinomycetospora lemnae]|uniref:DUF3040 domain-containing protein n=1 Tax=Actinomycetospora lemnae TaxID=3019891 RepID=A0ABT5SZU5_9PSEU|nr:DUF3040 domain-containing protein [Actinomycetospora sp. DW7H6]MDD7968398.1 DUF3040 domain-containing protein [Actinomycetospora sp. DW7H6]
MLDDRERAALLDIENHLLAEDPAWSTAFSTWARRARRRRRFELAFHTLAAVVSAALALLMVVANAPAPATFFVAVTVLLAWLVHRLRRAPLVREGPGGGGGPEATPR